MNEIWEVAKQVPSLAMLVAVVWFFLKHLEARDTALAAVAKEINAACLDERKESRAVIAANTSVVQKNNETRGALMEVIRALNEKLK